MSDVKRYEFDRCCRDCCLYESSLGEYVEHSDYETLLAENERLRDEINGDSFPMVDQISILEDSMEKLLSTNAELEHKSETAESQLREAEGLVSRAKAFADTIIRCCLDKRPEHETIKTLEKASIGFSKSAHQFLSTLPDSNKPADEGGK